MEIVAVSSVGLPVTVKLHVLKYFVECVSQKETLKPFTVSNSAYHQRFLGVCLYIFHPRKLHRAFIYFLSFHPLYSALDQLAL